MGDRVLILAVTVGESLTFLRGQARHLKEKGYSPVFISNPDLQSEAFVQSEKVNFIGINMERNPSILKDAVSFFKILMLIIRLRPVLVNAGTPKAGFLFMLAAWLLRVPVRIYTLHGFRHWSLVGARKVFQVLVEKFACYCSTNTFCVSQSVKEEALRIGVDISKLEILGEGSCGIELSKFKRSQFLVEGQALRDALQIDTSDFVVGFAGRLIERKGIDEIVQSFMRFRQGLPQAKLLLVGGIDETQPLDPSLLNVIAENPDVIWVGWKADLGKYMAAMDVFFMPSHWEGFGNVLIEAASMELPVISSDAPGTRDAVSHGFNGVIHPIGDVHGFTSAITEYYEDKELRLRHGRNGPRWARKFGRDEYNIALLRKYEKFLAKIR